SRLQGSASECAGRGHGVPGGQPCLCHACRGGSTAGRLIVGLFTQADSWRWNSPTGKVTGGGGGGGWCRQQRAGDIRSFSRRLSYYCPGVARSRSPVSFLSSPRSLLGDGILGVPHTSGCSSESFTSRRSAAAFVDSCQTKPIAVRMSMMPLGTFLLFALCLLGAVIPQGLQYATFSHNATKFLHLIMDPDSGRLYLGATNFLFQLTSDLVMEEAVSTGPSLDSKDCLPPVTKQECPQAQETDNYNKLLLIDSLEKELIVCGSVWQGICEKRSLDFIDHVLFQPRTPGDTQYVAANDPNISTVGLIGYSKDNVPFLFVGRGYTSRGVGGSIPPITTRNLRAHPGEAAGSDLLSIFSYEETAKLAVGRLSEYNHHFIKSFTHGSSVYFLFYRRDIKSHSREYRTYISRICLDDSHYYSYVELPLVCRSEEKTYSLLQAAYITQLSREEEDVGPGQGGVLFAAFSAWQASSGKLREESALCTYTMDEVDRLATKTRDLCYTKDGRSEDGAEVAYIEYDVSSICVQLSADTLDAYPCGSDHTPSPMASRLPLEAAPILEKPDARLTAVAVSIEDGRTVIFLGDSKGQLHKVFLGATGATDLYASLVIQPGSPVSGDLFFDQPRKHLYAMTQA
ncbi:Plexin-B1, partial [Varanus komodoensis]